MARKNNKSVSKYEEYEEEFNVDTDYQNDVIEDCFYSNLVKEFSNNDLICILDVFLNKFIGLNRTIVCRTTDNTIDQFINKSEQITKDVFQSLITYILVIKRAHKIFSKDVLNSHCHDLLNLIITEGCRRNDDVLYKDKQNIIMFGKTMKNLKGDK